MESSNESKDSLISNFCNITGVEASRGQFYLESANWNLQLAIQSFFEHSEDIPMDNQPNPIPNPNPNPNPNVDTPEEQVRAQQLQQMFGNQPIVGQNSSDGEMSSPIPSPKITKKQSKSAVKPKSSSNIATLDSLKRQTDSGGSSDEEEGQAFYAGGSVRSGQQVLGPKKKNTDELVSNMFASAKAHGAEVVDPSDESKVKQRVNTFIGTGFKLGSNTEGSTPVHSVSSPAQRPPNREMILKLWRNGFSLNDGPLRDYSDPQNHEFLNSIKKGEIPRELIQTANGAEVDLNMEDHKSEEYMAPKRRAQAFSGEGHRLGNPTAYLVSSAVASNSSKDPKESEAEALKGLNVDPNQPNTNIQIRLSDGSRLVVKLNLTHTVAHIRQFICNARPVYSTQTFILMTTFPNKELNDETLTIKDANLSNASIVQKLK